MGSKARLSKNLAPIINQLIVDNNIQIYIEPFVGGANMIEHIACSTRIGYDINPYLIALWRGLQSGKKLPDNITKQEYKDIRDNKDKYTDFEIGVTGFLCSFSGKWFGGYACDEHGGRYRCEELKKNILKQVPQIQDVIFKHGNYENIPELVNCLLYCDPPYAGTTEYKDSFVSNAFWDWARIQSKNNIVLISEYQAPEDFEVIFEQNVTSTLGAKSTKKSIERVFRLKS